MGRPLVHPSAHFVQSLLARIENLWAEAGIGPEYLGALRTALRPASTGNSTSHAASIHLSRLTLPGLCCEAAGGAWQQAEVVVTAWSLLYLVAHLLDDATDGDIETGSAPYLDLGSAVNVATGLMTSAGLALSALEEAGISPETAQTIRRDFYRTGLKMCAGQHDRLTRFAPTLKQCWEMAGARSGIFFALACRVGARLAADDAPRLDLFGEFGYHLGVLIQIGDDLAGLWPMAGERSDLAAGRRWTLPVAFAMSVMPASERDQLHERLKAAPMDVAAEAEARRLMIESVAVLYLTIEAEKHRQQAAAALRAVTSPSGVRDELLTMLDAIASLGKA